MKKLLCSAAIASCATLLAFNLMGADKKILLIDSYHEGYPWSDGIVEGAKKAIGDKAELKVFRMDSKRNPSDEAKKAAAEKAKAEIESWKPDAVIAADDNSSKYIIVPFFKDKSLPFVFCGVNWDASAYGFPCSNVTGMLEVSLAQPLIDNLKKYAKGDRIGHLGKDNETDRKEGEWIGKKLNIKLDEVYVNTFEEWKKAYVDIQSRVDILILQNYAGIEGWNDAEAKKFILENTKIPTGGIMDFMAPFVLMAFAKSSQEQGEWAAYTALQIIGSKKVSDIPIAENKKAQIYLNLPLASKLGAKFPLDLLKTAKTIKD